VKFHALSNDGLTFEIGRWEVGATGIDDAAIGPWYQCHMCRLLYQSRGGILWGRRVKELVSATATDVENKSGGKTNERPIVRAASRYHTHTPPPPPPPPPRMKYEYHSSCHQPLHPPSTESTLSPLTHRHPQSSAASLLDRPSH